METPTWKQQLNLRLEDAGGEGADGWKLHQGAWVQKPNIG